MTIIAKYTKDTCTFNVVRKEDGKFAIEIPEACTINVASLSDAYSMLETIAQNPDDSVEILDEDQFDLNFN